MSVQRIIFPDGQEIEYRLEYRSRKTIGLKITSEGLIVHAPRRILGYQLQQVLLQKSNWILQKLNDRCNGLPSPIEWRHGVELQLLGLPILLELESCSRNRRPRFKHPRLTLALSDLSDIKYMQHCVTHWYKQVAIEDFQRRIALFSLKLDVKTPEVRLSNALTRWGSCNSKGHIRLNWRLIQAPPSLINYVICHELAHLKEMNHSPRFYKVLEGLYPDYKVAERQLKHLSSSLHRI